MKFLMIVAVREDGSSSRRVFNRERVTIVTVAGDCVTVRLTQDWPHNYQAPPGAGILWMNRILDALNGTQEVLLLEWAR